ncbi:MAG: acyl-ACP--UDP-N-acetylglucosamine O-acyltransferase [Deltaproteobacteria bacterium]|nr:acyl-ACP--UDP-N-acetylglucosamine O-acyltransferase [Deltaproteobacteria bacterium]
MTRIHPTAIVDPTAKLSEGVELGAYAVVEADVEIGAGTVIRPHAVIRRYTTMGAGNFVDSFVSLGGDPQDFKFDAATISCLRIGDNNTFREGVTISRATGQGQVTTVGNHTYWMANSHAGHNCTIHDDAVLVNGVLVAGHCTIGRGVILSGNCSTHQFCWVGESTMFQGMAGAGMHVPPYVVCSGINNVIALNAIGLRRRPDISPEDRKQIKEAFQITYRSGMNAARALEEMDSRKGWGEAAGRFREFLRQVLKAENPYNRGLCPHLSRARVRHGKGE